MLKRIAALILCLFFAAGSVSWASSSTDQMAWKSVPLLKHKTKKATQNEKAKRPANLSSVRFYDEYLHTDVGCEASNYNNLCDGDRNFAPSPGRKFCRAERRDVTVNNDAHFTVNSWSPSLISIHFYAKGSGNPVDRWGSHSKMKLWVLEVPAGADDSLWNCNMTMELTNACLCYGPNFKEVLSRPQVCHELQCRGDCLRQHGEPTRYKYGGKEGC